MADPIPSRGAQLLRMIADFGDAACDDPGGIQAVLLSIEGIAPGAIDRAHASLTLRRLGLDRETAH
ncbi:MAG: hypothetical protein EON90_13300 [Brevundimonas sp.]|nr:MAG: hypothetical protein EON90_13300 [Brevundimonas sp.]